MPGNYRPISIISIFAKIFEMIVFKRLSAHLKDGDYIHSSQYGFRQKHSTSSALLHIISCIQNKIQKKYYVIALFIDLSKAFDTVDHEILLYKLDKNMNCKNNDLLFFKSYLENRKMRTIANNFSSELTDIKLGVPQGSVLGPSLFNIYINDLPNHLSLSETVMFADDTTIIISDKSLNNLHSKCETTIKELSKWIEENKLYINTKKTKFMKFFSDDFSASMNGNIIECVPCFKLLGVTIDNSFNFKTHCKTVYNKLIYLFHVFYSIRNKLNTDSKLIIYNSYVQSILTYCLVIYGNTPNKNTLLKLEVLQKRLLKCLFFNNHIKSNNIFIATNILPLSKHVSLSRFNFFDSILQYDAYPEYLNNLLQQKSKILRNYILFILPKKPKKTCSLLFNLLKYYNSIPLQFKNNLSFTKSKNYKTYLLTSVS